MGQCAARPAVYAPEPPPQMVKSTSISKFLSAPNAIDLQPRVDESGGLSEEDRDLSSRINNQHHAMDEAWVTKFLSHHRPRNLSLDSVDEIIPSAVSVDALDLDSDSDKDARYTASPTLPERRSDPVVVLKSGSRRRRFSRHAGSPPPPRQPGDENDMKDLADVYFSTSRRRRKTVPLDVEDKSRARAYRAKTRLFEPVIVP